MYSLLKDIINPKNWIKLLLNPKKIKTVYERIFYYPGLKFGYSKSNLYKKILIKSTIFLARRNKKFREIFFSKNKDILFEEIYYKFTKNIFDETQTKSLNANGILVLENVLNVLSLMRVSGFKTQINSPAVISIPKFTAFEKPTFALFLINTICGNSFSTI